MTVQITTTFSDPHGLNAAVESTRAQAETELKSPGVVAAVSTSSMPDEKGVHVYSATVTWTVAPEAA